MILLPRRLFGSQLAWPRFGVGCGELLDQDVALIPLHKKWVKRNRAWSPCQALIILLCASLSAEPQKANNRSLTLSFPPHTSMYSRITEELLIAISAWTSVGTT